MKPRHLLSVVFLVLLLTACRPSRVETIPTIEEDESAAAALAGGSLASLSSYRFTLEMTTSREIDGRMVEEIETIIQEATRSPEEILHIKHIRQNEEIGIIPLSSDRYRQGLLAFESEQRPEGDVCHIYDIEQSPLAEDGAIDPQVFFENAERKGPDDRGRVVNDVVADRFSATGLDLPLDVVEEETALLWVAQKGGYIVRFTVEAKGQLMVDGENKPASLKWEYNLYDSNKEMEIALSPDCQQQKDFLDSLPIPDAAQEMEIMDNSVTFSYPETTLHTVEFIRDEMQSAGWKSIQDIGEEEDGFYILQYQQGDDFVDVMIGRPEEGGAFVTFSQRP
jgi:hypothetical protein